jgi:hypothetical protein
MDMDMEMCLVLELEYSELYVNKETRYMCN